MAATYIRLWCIITQKNTRTHHFIYGLECSMATTNVCNVHTQGFSMFFYDSNEMVLGNQHVSTNLDIITVLQSVYTVKYENHHHWNERRKQMMCFLLLLLSVYVVFVHLFFGCPEFRSFFSYKPRERYWASRKMIAYAYYVADTSRNMKNAF